MVLQSQGKNSEAQAILEALTQHRGFYPMVPSHNCDLSIYLLCIAQTHFSKQEENVLLESAF